jgi:hypothetical protein
VKVFKKPVEVSRRCDRRLGVQLLSEALDFNVLLSEEVALLARLLAVRVS